MSDTTVHAWEDNWRVKAIERPGRWIPIIGVLAEDQDGTLCVPSLRRRDWWAPRFDARKPWHWLSYLNSRITRRITMVEWEPDA